MQHDEFNLYVVRERLKRVKETCSDGPGRAVIVRDVKIRAPSRVLHPAVCYCLDALQLKWIAAPYLGSC